MVENAIAVLYHGTDVESALKILTYGLNEEDLAFWQLNRKLQSGPSWYTTDSLLAANYFASIAPGNRNQGSTIIAMDLFVEHLEMLVEQGLAKKERIRDVYFIADQYWFDLKTLPFLNEHAIFRPHYWEDD